jgi:hypothetical protein
MSAEMEIAMRAVLIGAGATLVMDLWTLFLKRVFGVRPLDYAMVGRWIGHFRHGSFAHESIAKATPIQGETVIGWGAHYAIGIVFAFLLLMLWGLDWAREPRLLPALIVGLITVAAPFLVMQPGMGAGIAAAKTPNPTAARLRSLATHAVFGIGLYGSAWLVRGLF